jgi:hypothetical protein
LINLMPIISNKVLSVRYVLVRQQSIFDWIDI